MIKPSSTHIRSDQTGAQARPDDDNEAIDQVDGGDDGQANEPETKLHFVLKLTLASAPMLFFKPLITSR